MRNNAICDQACLFGYLKLLFKTQEQEKSFQDSVIHFTFFIVN